MHSPHDYFGSTPSSWWHDRIAGGALANPLWFTRMPDDFLPNGQENTPFGAQPVSRTFPGDPQAVRLGVMKSSFCAILAC